MRSITNHHDLYAGHVMSRDVVFFRPIEKVGVVNDLLTSCTHSFFPVVDTSDNDVLYGTMTSHKLICLLRNGVFSENSTKELKNPNENTSQGHVKLGPFDTNYIQLIP